MDINLPEGIIQIQPTGPLWYTYLSKTKKDFDLASKILSETGYTRSTGNGNGRNFMHKDARAYGPIKNIALDKSWLWSPLKFGEETYEKILSVIGLPSDKHYYYRDIVTMHIPDMMKIIEHFTTIDVSTVKLDYNKGIDVLDDLAVQTGCKQGAPRSYNDTHLYLTYRAEFERDKDNSE